MTCIMYSLWKQKSWSGCSVGPITTFGPILESLLPDPRKTLKIIILVFISFMYFKIMSSFECARAHLERG